MEDEIETSLPPEIAMEVVDAISVEKEISWRAIFNFVLGGGGEKILQTNIKKVPLTKCLGFGTESLCRISAIHNGDSKVFVSNDSDHVSWPIDWNKEFLPLMNYVDKYGKIIRTRKKVIVDKYGNIIKNRKWVIVPTNGSKLATLTDSNLWRKEGYVELGKD
ncbi:hypothetical protein D8674_033811 [Pyrus ussuriensis x Pyrus communis]|uniref:Uncharacterized protein n=1 Tax=Pyrus ussuriensis x Pyrus communis TaxID=2448454 RepID=A0A5N5HM31_9ROSA|nr:hypothetical protein D8674_033811 [Pyrus ussuriensis x Pyrus communis]